MLAERLEILEKEITVKSEENKGNKGPNQEKEITSFPFVQEEKQE